VFIGFVAENQADCASKVVPKASPDEPVGVLCMRGGKPSVAEYTEISKEARHLRDASGNLVYSASHICINAFSLRFLKRHALDPLPFHVAFKKVPYAAGPKGELVTPPAPNGYKAEMFIFDMFQYAERMCALLVPREIEFSPLKNPPGSPSDCPETCRAAVYALHANWAKAAGAKVDASASNVCEISPLVSFAGEGLESLQGKEIALPFHFECPKSKL
jgi:UDP-N-acetylglucosamine/UDP-N-acetylgalactosamine diphosphorylase